MKKNYIFPLLLATLVGACSSTKLPATEGILNQDLIDAYDDQQKTLNVYRSELLFDNNKLAHNCTSYLELSKNSTLVESVNNMMVKSEYLICDAMEILSRSKHINGPRLNSRHGEKLARNLDLRSFPSSLFRAADETNHTLYSLFSAEVDANENVALYDSSDWLLRVEVAAEAYINENEFKDWIVWVSDEAKNGNYRSYSTLIIYDPSINDSYQATLIP